MQDEWYPKWYPHAPMSTDTASKPLQAGVGSAYPSLEGVCAMAAETKREPGPLKRRLQKLRASWRRAGDMQGRAGAARRADHAKQRPGSGGDSPGSLGSWTGGI